jgi:hypothetical protein
MTQRNWALALALAWLAACYYDPPGTCSSIVECNQGADCVSGICVTIGTLDVAPSKPDLVSDGVDSVTLLITATDGVSKPGVGTVTVRAPAGYVDGQYRDTVTVLAGGNTVVSYACDVTRDENCVGAQSIMVFWKGEQKAVTVNCTSQ